MIRHMLLIKFKAEVTALQIAEIQAHFMALPTRIAEVDAVEWGCNDSPEQKNQGYTHAVLMTFADENARQTYLPHPAHVALQQVFAPVLADIIVLDYTLM